MTVSPLEGWRHVEVTRSPHRRRLCADYQRPASERALPQCLADRSNCRTISTRTNQRHFMRYFPRPKHAASSSGSSGTTHRNTEVGWTWPRSELGVVSSQCLDRRIPEKQTLIEEVAAWEDDRNKNHTKADWQFTTADARDPTEKAIPNVYERLRRLGGSRPPLGPDRPEHGRQVDVPAAGRAHCTYGTDRLLRAVAARADRGCRQDVQSNWCRR